MLNALLQIPYLVYWAGILALLAALGYFLLGSRPVSFLHGLCAALLTVGGALGALSFYSYQLGSGVKYNAYEFFHYYLGAKYAEEVGYTKLYAAATIADAEPGWKQGNGSIRDLETGRMVSVRDVVAREKKAVQARFTPERWTEFTRDVSNFHKSFRQPRVWNKMLSDKGYNASPVWTMVGGVLANRVDSGNRNGLMALALLDIVGFVVTGLLLWRCFDHRAALFFAIFVVGHYMPSSPSMKAAFLRFDWLFCLVIAMGCLKKGWYAPAGALTAYAAATRLFPAVFVFGLFARLVWVFLRERRVEWKYMRFFAAFAGMLALLAGLAFWYMPHVWYWREFVEKIVTHNSDISPWRVGFKYLFLGFFGAHPWVWRGIVAGVLLLVAVLVQRREDHEAFALGYAAIFFLVAPTYYYQMMLALPVLYFAGNLNERARSLGLIVVFASAPVGFYLQSAWGRGFEMFNVLTWMLFAVVSYMVLHAGVAFVPWKRAKT